MVRTSEGELSRGLPSAGVWLPGNNPDLCAQRWCCSHPGEAKRVVNRTYSCLTRQNFANASETFSEKLLPVEDAFPHAGLFCCEKLPEGSAAALICETGESFAAPAAMGTGAPKTPGWRKGPLPMVGSGEPGDRRPPPPRV